MHFPVALQSRFKISLLEWRAVDVINKTSTRKKWLDRRVVPDGAFSTVAEHNFSSGRLSTCGKVTGWGAGGREHG